MFPKFDGILSPEKWFTPAAKIFMFNVQASTNKFADIKFSIGVEARIKNFKFSS